MVRRAAVSSLPFVSSCALLFALPCALVACVHRQEVRRLVAYEAPSDLIVIVDAQVFPATGPEALAHHDVVVRSGAIEAVRPTGEPPPAGARVIDGRGKTVLPGLVDAHFHTHVAGAPPWYISLAEPTHVLEEALFAGITTAHDMGGPPESVLALRDAVADGRVIGPRMKVAGAMLTAPGGYPASYIARAYPWPLSAVGLSDVIVELHDVAEAERAVDALADARVDFIKVALAQTPDTAPVLSPEIVRAISARAHARGLRVAAHIDSANNALLAIENGVDFLVHGVHSTPLTDNEADRLRTARGVAPTLIVFERLWQLKHDALSLSEIEKQSVATNLQRELPRRAESGYELDPELAAWLSHLDEHRAARIGTNVTKLRDRGVQILVGSDGHGSTATFPAALHEEMRLLSRAGVPNADILLGATAWSARMTTDTPTFGTLEPGKDADLLIVDGDPLTDIASTERIAFVMQRGRVVRRAAPTP